MPQTSPFTRETSIPLQEWEREDKVNLEVVTYGWEGTKCTIRFYLPMERDKQRLHDMTRNLIRDVKHSRDWMCEFCGRIARETQVMTLTWTHLSPPRMAIFIHHICNHDRQECFAELEEHHYAIKMLNNLPQTPLPRPRRKRPGDRHPRASSCAGCQKDATSSMELQRCSRCKLTRYCGTECQRDDWKRHKQTCSQIYSVLFEGWDDRDAAPQVQQLEQA
ncbi:hypothetical protein L226DRAFT_555144 [Lentinus tigrinus ALCF2SS1-7]|uniref:MYND-type domain-containing protein n=1 Tax=Lentinus tigrinus ALCF2SS1-6 TaxID=1328759 RepID=A0A5C2S8X7_9APHY|nr:hypothetical protein L227DRAFT_575362 [Lentinus tigrinus ALCF2SS1-6]RPD69547.1 hypothetical protein L226DRAFT_555144 [Lentinus tigrinus ALCF2SS1-7]